MLTVNLPPEVESQLRQNAAEQGYDTDTYVNSLILQALRQPVPPIIPAQTTAEDFLARWETLAQQTVIHASHVSPAQLHEPAFRREDIYGDEGR